MSKIMNKASFLCLGLALFIIYSPVIFFPYLFHDDVYFWIKEPWAPLHYQHMMLMHMGRPLAAWIATSENHWVHAIGDLQVLRFLSVLIFAVSAGVCFQEFKRWLNNNVQAWCLTVMVFTLPGFEDIAFYAVGWFFSVAVLLICIAYRILRTKASWIGWTTATILMFASILIYPPAAMFFWVMVFLSVLTKEQNRIFICSSGLCAITIFGVFLLTTHHPLNLDTTSVYNPGMLEGNWWDKAVWFFQEPFVNALNGWDVYPEMIIAVSVAGIILAAVVLKTKENFKSLILLENVAWIIALIILSFLPSLIANGHAAYYRCLIGLGPLVLIMFVWALKQWVCPQKVFTSIMIILVLVGGYKAFDNILNHRVIQSYKELSLFRSMAQTVHFKETDHLLIVLPNHYKALERYDEFGVWTSHYALDILLLLKAVFEEAGIQKWPTVMVIPPGQNAPVFYKGYIYHVLPNGEQLATQLGRPVDFKPVDLGMSYDPTFNKGVTFIPTKILKSPQMKRLFILDVRDFHKHNG